MVKDLEASTGTRKPEFPADHQNKNDGTAEDTTTAPGLVTNTHAQAPIIPTITGSDSLKIPTEDKHLDKHLANNRRALTQPTSKEVTMEETHNHGIEGVAGKTNSRKATTNKIKTNSRKATTNKMVTGRGKHSQSMSRADYA